MSFIKCRRCGQRNSWQGGKPDLCEECGGALVPLTYELGARFVFIALFLVLCGFLYFGKNQQWVPLVMATAASGAFLETSELLSFRYLPRSLAPAGYGPPLLTALILSHVMVSPDVTALYFLGIVVLFYGFFKFLSGPFALMWLLEGPETRKLVPAQFPFRLDLSQFLGWDRSSPDPTIESQHGFFEMVNHSGAQLTISFAPLNTDTPRDPGERTKKIAESLGIAETGESAFTPASSSINLASAELEMRGTIRGVLSLLRADQEFVIQYVGPKSFVDNHVKDLIRTFRFADDRRHEVFKVVPWWRSWVV